VDSITYKDARALLAPRKKSPKFKNKAFWQDGIYWHSKREYRRWLQLLDMKDKGEISSLRRQHAFDLHVNGIKIGRYCADFTYESSEGQFVVEDVKARRGPNQSRSATATAIYQRSKRHLKAEYGLDITEI
jgi:hypothetical protein